MLSNFKNVVYDTDMTAFVPKGGFPYFEFENEIGKKGSDGNGSQGDQKVRKSILDRILEAIGIKPKKLKNNILEDDKSPKSGKDEEPKDSDIKRLKLDELSKLSLKDQMQYFLALPEEEYSDKKLTSAMRDYIVKTEQNHNAITADYKSKIAPSFWQVKGNMVNISGVSAKSYYVQEYPSYIEALWVRDIYSYSAKRDMSFFLYKEDSSAIQTSLRSKSTQIKSDINEATRKGITVDVDIELKYRDIETIRQKLATHEESYFELGTYMTIYNEKEEKIAEESKKIEQIISGSGITAKQAVQRMDEGFITALPLCNDELGITRSAITSSIASGFPFISSDLCQDTGIFYGLNMHTGSLVIFDRFNKTLSNMNSVVLATSGAGKSFTVKLEIMRYLIQGIKVLVIDPENEYKDLCEKLGGTYINIASNSHNHINPFDLPPKNADREYQKGDLLRSKIMDLIGLIQILVGGLSPIEESILDKALQLTYQLKGINLDEDDYIGKEIPMLADLYNVLDGMEGAEDLNLKLSKFVTGTFGGIFNVKTNVNVNNNLTVFSIRDLEDALKTSAMYNILNYIWTSIRSERSEKMLICDEARIMLQNDTSANFLFGLTKRARKYNLGITTISQDIEDFVRSQYGKPIISNSAMQILLKQSTSSIKMLDQLIGLSEAEKHRLVSSGTGEGLFLAGNQHVAIKIIASQFEREIIDSKKP